MSQQAQGQLNEFHGDIVNIGGTLVAGATFNLGSGGHVFIGSGQMLGEASPAFPAIPEAGHVTGEGPKELLDTGGICLLSLGGLACPFVIIFFSCGLPHRYGGQAGGSHAF
jgi:hypothetical protein